LFVLSRRHLLSLAAVPASIALAPAAWAAPRPITEAGFVPIGGIDQWVAIRGQDRSRPAILFLHGGPCEAESPFLSMFAPWEKHYVVAQWDQRGSGRTFGKNGTSTPSMTHEQLAQDAIEVTEYVLSRLKVRKLILVGHSMGAFLGLDVIRLRPELFRAFVGAGQPVSGREIFEAKRSTAVARAEAAGDAQAVAQLKGLGPDALTDDSKFGIVFRWQPPPTGSDKEYFAAHDALLGTPNKPASATAADWLSARSFCVSKLARFDFDVREAGYDLPVPFFVIQGRDDTICPPDAARAFVDQVRAPEKGYTAIEGGHMACFTNPTAFLNALDTDIRRLGIS
jgi:pimeloyl-ACP methyl ester carboxylesterase